MRLVCDFLFIKNSKNVCVRATKLEKLTFISKLNSARLTVCGEVVAALNSYIEEDTINIRGHTYNAAN